MKNTWMPATIAVAATIASRSSESVPKPRAIHVPDDHGAERRGRRGRATAPSSSPCSSRIRPSHLSNQRIALAELEVAVGAAAEAEPDHLGADDDQQRAADQRVSVERAARERSGARTRPASAARRAAIITSPGIDEQRSSGCRRGSAAGGASRRACGDSFDSPPRGWYSIGNSRMSRCSSRRPDHHLRGELHPRRVEVEQRQHVAAQGAHAAVHVAHVRLVEQVEEAGEERDCRRAGSATASRPSWMLSIRSPITSCAPSSSSFTKRGISAKSYVRSASAITM